MNTRRRMDLLFLYICWLILLLPSMAMLPPLPMSPNHPHDDHTNLTIEAPLFIQPKAKPQLLAQLTNGQAMPIPGMDLMLMIEVLPPLHARTDAQGKAAFPLLFELTEGAYPIKVIFSGAPGLRPAIAMGLLNVSKPLPLPTALATTPATATSTPLPTAPPPPTPIRQIIGKAQAPLHQAPPTVSAPAKQASATSEAVAEQKFLANQAAPSSAGDATPQKVQAIALASPGQKATTGSVAQPQAPLVTGFTLFWLKLQAAFPLTGVRNLMAAHPKADSLLLFSMLALLLFVASPTLRTRSFTLVGRFAQSTPNLTRPSQPIIPISVWYGLRVFAIGLALGIALVLFVRPATGLFLFWKVFIPCVPLLFFVAPGVWRNICPMATLNQTPRLFNFTRAWTLPKWLQEYGYVTAIGLFLILVSSRKVLFNQNGPALALLILASLIGAFVMGNFFKGKSGWCSSICPLLPIQRIYGQTPFVNVANAHCEPCIGCTKNCYDFNPQVAYLADLYDPDRHFSAYRKFFVGLFPGFILAFYLLPNPPAIPIWQMYLGFGLASIFSLGTFFCVETLVKVTTNKITVIYGALALNLYYWFNAPTLGAWFGTPAPFWFVWPLRSVVLGLTLLWIYRTYRKEPQFIELTLTSNISQVLANPATTNNQPAPTTSRQPAKVVIPEVVVEPEGRCITVAKNRTLLEIIESNNLPIEAGCRMGVCGADPICVLEGMDQLSKIGSEERATLERLGLAPNTRMACMARVRGNVKISLTPAKPDVFVTSVVAGFRYDRTVERVVIIGNGIAGVTAADHLRRRHPRCEIHLIGRERHHLYNRMGITRLIYGRSAMQGLYLLPDQWYEDFNITCWLNTHVTKLDAQARQVTLGTGETLPYDRLILTTGSQSYVPPIAGCPMSGVFVLREAEDAMAIRAFVQSRQCRSAVIAGGGLLGLEAAYGLQKLGLTVTVLERSNALLRRQLDARGAEFLRSYLEELGIHILMEAEVVGVQDQRQVDEPSSGRVQQITLKDGRPLACDLLLVAAGIRSEIELARSVGLAVGQGVIVDAQMRTSDPNIFAAGDVAEFDGKTYGLWPVAVSQAEVAANNAVAGPNAPISLYTEMPPVTMLKVVGVDLTSMGRIEPQNAAEQVIVFEEEATHRYRKLIIAGGKIVGAILLGYPQEAPGVAEAVKQQMDVTPYLAALQAGDWQALTDLAQ
ncbi:MAG: FAD-dependent oxidoreductase [Caldilineaceae bacterium]